MKLEIKYFANLAEITGTDSETIEFKEHIVNVAQLKQLLSERGDDWQAMMSSPSTRCAVDQVLANDNTELPEVAEIAFFPPVTGG